MAQFITVQRKVVGKSIPSQVNVDHISYYYADDIKYGGTKIVLNFSRTEGEATLLRVEETYEEISNLLSRGNKEGMVY